MALGADQTVQFLQLGNLVEFAVRRMNSQERNALRFILFSESLHRRNRLHTWATPRTPEIEDQHLASIIRNATLLAIGPACNSQSGAVVPMAIGFGGSPPGLGDRISASLIFVSVFSLSSSLITSWIEQRGFHEL